MCLSVYHAVARGSVAKNLAKAASEPKQEKIPVDNRSHAYSPPQDTATQSTHCTRAHVPFSLSRVPPLFFSLSHSKKETQTRLQERLFFFLSRAAPVAPATRVSSHTHTHTRERERERTRNWFWACPCLEFAHNPIFSCSRNNNNSCHQHHDEQ